MPQHTDLVNVQRVRANGTVLYTETRGNHHDRPVLLIPGAGGDAGTLAGVSVALAAEFTVLTYDRRGNSRSPRPAGWAATSLAEQADDAASLLAVLGDQPALVVGTSAGGSIALELTLRHPEAVRATVIHEPPIMSLIANPQAVGAGLATLIGEGMTAGGPRTAMERFLRWAGGDSAYDSIAPADRDRCLDNGQVFFEVEMPPFMAYRPTARALGGARRPLRAAASRMSRDPTSPHHFLYAAASQLAEQVGTDLVEIPGRHMAYLTEPERVAERLRLVLQNLS